MTGNQVFNEGFAPEPEIIWD